MSWILPLLFKAKTGDVASAKIRRVRVPAVRRENFPARVSLKVSHQTADCISISIVEAVARGRHQTRMAVMRLTDKHHAVIAKTQAERPKVNRSDQLGLIRF